MVNLDKTFSAARRALEQLYTDRCTVYIQQEAEPSDGCLTRFEDRAVYADQPCRVSFSVLSAASGGSVAVTSQSIRLFLPPGLVIPPGSRIDILRPGEVPRTLRYKASGPAAVYPTHQEIPLELAGRYA